MGRWKKEAMHCLRRKNGSAYSTLTLYACKRKYYGKQRNTLDRCMETEYNRISALCIGMYMTKGGNKIYVLQKLCRGSA